MKKKTQPSTPESSDLGSSASSSSASPEGAPTSEQRGQALQVVAPGKLLTREKTDLSNAETSAEIGHQLTEQYQKAVGGMTEVLRFGGMMMALREKLSTVVQVRTTGGKFDEKAEGSLKKWLSTYASEVKFGTAFRFLHVAEAVCNEFENTSTLTFVDLVTTPTDQLPEPALLSQQELWDFVSGTSQRSWLDRFAPAAPKVINAPAQPVRRKTPEAIEEMHRAEVTAVFAAAYDAMLKKEWHYLPDEMIRGSIDIFSEFISEATAHIAIPKRDRVALKVKAIANK